MILKDIIFYIVCFSQIVEILDFLEKSRMYFFSKVHTSEAESVIYSAFLLFSLKKRQYLRSYPLVDLY